MKEKVKWNDYDALPLILDVTDIQGIMGFSRASAYELVHTPGFPVVRSCRLFKSARKPFLIGWTAAAISTRTKKRKQRNREMEYEEDFYDEAV